MFTPDVLTDDKEHAERFFGIFAFGQEIRRHTERKSNFGWLVEVGLQNVPKMRTLVHERGSLDENAYLLKTRNDSSTWSSCLFETVRRILSYNSSSESGWLVCRR